ncbi:Gfo/Idh/MocA family protein [Roseomonas sp. BN140053]|uniref:Gfo/Idh/MocA family protein n=1 Tax=Roseomonas sp. BN140053 TaxID=3391898 RepID=UPI0039E8F2AB
MPDTRPVGWGIIGFGWVARDFAAPAIAAAGHRLVAVCDPGEAARAAAAATLPPDAIHATPEALLANPAVEAVYVATPNHLHRTAVELAAAAGKPVLCEKPMTATLAEAEAMAAAVQRSGMLYGTAFDQRHHPAHRAIRAALRDGLLGTVTTVRIVYACWLDANWSPTGEGDNWRVDPRRAGGGALMDLAPHGLDLVDFLLDEPLRDIAALTQHRVQDYAVDDGAVLLGRTASGVLATLHVAYNHPETLPRRRLEILGTRGLLVAENTMGQDAGGRVTFLDADTGEARPVPVPRPDLSPFTQQMAAFAEAVRSGESGGFSIARDLHTMRLLDRAYRAAENAACL